MIDFLIIGQGLAGSILGWTLHQAGKSILIIDNGHKTSASQVGAGFMNYISGKRLTLTWEAPTLIPFAESFYQQLEHQFDTSFFHTYPEYRFFTTEKEVEYRKKRYNTPLNNYFKRPLTPSNYHPFNTHFNKKNECYGGEIIDGSSMLNIPHFLDTLQTYFKQTNQLIHHHINWNSIQFSDDTISIENPIIGNRLTAKNIILCAGSELRHTPWFSNIQYRSAKGETLTLSCSQKIPIRLYNFGKWLIPFNNHWRLGATYEWDNLNHMPTPQGKKLLLDSLHQMGITEDKIIDHQAAIRCITPDNAPLIGTHPHHSRLHVFSGLGSRGVMTAPYYAKRFTQTLLSNTPISDHVNVNRYM